MEKLRTGVCGFDQVERAVDALGGKVPGEAIHVVVPSFAGP